MTDFTDKLPLLVWENIAGYLTLPDLAAFKTTCHLFNAYGSHPNFIRYIYNQFLLSEIDYLKQNQPNYFTDEISMILSTPPNSMQALQEQNTILDAINIDIIKEIIDHNISSNFLKLRNMDITRIPLSLLHDEQYQTYWQNLKKLSCSKNQIKTLDVRSLRNLEELDCIENQLSSLKIQGLNNLKLLACHRNQLKNLDIQDLNSLERIYIEQNPIDSFTLNNVQQERLKNYLPLNIRRVVQPSPNEHGHNNQPGIKIINRLTN